MSTTNPLPVRELEARLRAGGLTLAFDTNAVENHRAFLDACDAIQRLNARREAQKIGLAVYAVAHGEKLLHLRQGHKQDLLGPFDDDHICADLKDRGIEIMAFEERHARRVAVRLQERYRTRQEWREEKKQRYLQALGMVAHAGLSTATGKKCSATVDWLLAAQAEIEGHILVTDDKGPEFACLAERVPFDTLAEALGRLGPFPPPQARPASR